MRSFLDPTCGSPGLRSTRGLLRALAVVCLLAPHPASVAGPPPQPEPLGRRTASYIISVTLDPATKSLHGSEVLVWTNPSTDLIRELQFHLYLNAFKHPNTSFLKDEPRSIDLLEREGWGSVDITSMRTAGGDDLTQRIEFIRPDDDNPMDETAIRVPLTTPVPAGGTLELTIEFTARIPRLVARTGFAGDFFFLGQWFPKIAVYEPAGTRYAVSGGWNCHQFHGETEFYGDFGTYEVSVTLPERFVVGATGLMTGTIRTADSLKTVTYRAEDVHNFAWTAYPDFLPYTERWNHVTVQVLVPSGREQAARRYASAARLALDFMTQHVGPYPYTTLTIVDPPEGGARAGGMEYPTLMTAGSSIQLGESFRDEEQVVVHEFVHQYFQGIVASNEYEEAWLDEGFTQYYENRIMDAAYGRRTAMVDLGPVAIGNREFARSTYTGMRNPRLAAIATPGWLFPGNSYGVISYNKTALVLSTLEGLLGTSLMDSVMRIYVSRWGFRHPSGQDFVRVVNDVSGRDMTWFFEQLIRGTGICDYAVTAIRNGERSDPDAVSSVTVGRLGDVHLPVDLLVRFEDGTERTESWDGVSSMKVFTYQGTPYVQWARLDPEGKIPLDLNVINNSMSAEPPAGASRYSFSVLFLMQTLIQIVAALT